MTVVIVGDVLLDAVVRRFDPIARGSDTPARIRWRQGGAGASTARWLCTIGRLARIVGKVGDDSAGAMLRLDLDAVGVDVRYLSIDRQVPTGSVIAMVADDERDMLTDRGASAMLSPRDLVPGWLDGASHVHVSGYTLLHGETRDAGLEAIAAARRAGISVSVDPASHSPIQTVGADALLRWLEGATTVLPNLSEARVLTGCEDVDDAARQLGGRIGEAVVTNGPLGAVWSDGSQVSRVGAPTPSGPIDPVGAGDAFTAGWLAARVLDGTSPGQALAGATALAARAISRSG